MEDLNEVRVRVATERQQQENLNKTSVDLRLLVWRNSPNSSTRRLSPISPVTKRAQYRYSSRSREPLFFVSLWLAGI